MKHISAGVNIEFLIKFEKRNKTHLLFKITLNRHETL